jgi:hypothetical protein
VPSEFSLKAWPLPPQIARFAIDTISPLARRRLRRGSARYVSGALAQSNAMTAIRVLVEFELHVLGIDLDSCVG